MLYTQTLVEKEADKLMEVIPEPGDNPHEKGWYECILGEYVLSNDR